MFGVSGGLNWVNCEMFCLRGSTVYFGFQFKFLLFTLGFQFEFQQFYLFIYLQPNILHVLGSSFLK